MLHCRSRRPPGAFGLMRFAWKRFCRGLHDVTPSLRGCGPVFRKPKPAGAGGLYGRDLCQRAVVVFGAAFVHENGIAAAWRLARGVVGGDGVLPVAAARG